MKYATITRPLQQSAELVQILPLWRDPFGLAGEYPIDQFANAERTLQQSGLFDGGGYGEERSTGHSRPLGEIAERTQVIARIFRIQAVSNRVREIQGKASAAEMELAPPLSLFRRVLSHATS